MSQRFSELDLLLNCPRGKFSVDLFNVLHTHFKAWRVVTARCDNVDFFGQEIKEGEAHYFRATGPGVAACDRLTFLSMDRLLWLTFGDNEGLVEFCKSLIESRKAEAARDAQKYREACNRMTLGGDA